MTQQTLTGQGLRIILTSWSRPVRHFRLVRTPLDEWLARLTKRPIPDKAEHSQAVDINAFGGNQSSNPSRHTFDRAATNILVNKLKIPLIFSYMLFDGLNIGDFHLNKNYKPTANIAHLLWRWKKINIHFCFIVEEGIFLCDSFCCPLCGGSIYENLWRVLKNEGRMLLPSNALSLKHPLKYISPFALRYWFANDMQ
jgi:hypothetical protein